MTTPMNAASAAERNPLAYWLLALHPYVFAGAAVGWAVLFGSVVLLWRHWWANALAVLLTIGHAVGGSSWLARHGAGGWALAVGYLLVAAWLAKWCWRRAGWGRP